MIHQISNSINEKELLDKIRDKLKLVSSYKSIDKDNINLVKSRSKGDAEIKKELDDFEIKVKDFNQMSLATDVFNACKDEFVSAAKVDSENEAASQLFADKIKEVIATMINQTRLNSLFTASQAKSAVIDTLSEEKQNLIDKLEQVQNEKTTIRRIRNGELLRPYEPITGKKRVREDDTETPDVKRVKLSTIDKDLLMSFSGFRKSTLKVILENQHMDALNQSTDTDIKDKRKAYNIITAFLDLRESTLDDTDNFKKLQILTHELFSGSEGGAFYNQLLELVAKLKPALLVNTDSADTDVQVSSTLGFS